MLPGSLETGCLDALFFVSLSKLAGGRWAGLGENLIDLFSIHVPELLSTTRNKSQIKERVAEQGKKRKKSASQSDRPPGSSPKARV